MTQCLSLKCNVGSVWSGDNNTGGAAWIIRDSAGKVMFHSRHSFTGIRSQLEADIIAAVWAIEAVKDLCMNRVIIEFSSSRFPVTTSQFCLPWLLRNQWRKLRRAIDQLEMCHLVLLSRGGNHVATAITESAVNIDHHQSYQDGGVTTSLIHCYHVSRNRNAVSEQEKLL